jgi:hypothetical protein
MEAITGAVAKIKLMGKLAASRLPLPGYYALPDSCTFTEGYIAVYNTVKLHSGYCELTVLPQQWPLQRLIAWFKVTRRGH